MIQPTTKSTNNAEPKKANAVRRKRGHYKARNATGIIQAGMLYSIDAICSALGTTRGTVGDWRAKGLEACSVGNRTMFLGDDLIAFFKSQKVSVQ